MSPLTTRRQPLTLGALLAAATLALSGCAGPATPSSQPSNTAAATIGQPVVTPATTAPPAGCPVDAATLERAFKANTALADAIVLGGGFVNITCYQDFAVARATPTNVDAALVLFAYDPATRTWRALTGGTAVRCGEHVPAAIVAHLPGCVSE